MKQLLLSIIIIGAVYFVWNSTRIEVGSVTVQGLYPTVKGAVTNADPKQTICNPNWSTSQVRPPTSYTTPIKNRLAKEQGVDPSKFELDHADSIELLGDPKSLDNLWLEPYDLMVNGIPAGARQKDQVENYLHKQVCLGNITLQEAQKEIISSWFEIYKTKILGKFGNIEVTDEDDI